MLNIKNLEASIEGNKILKGLNLDIKPGEVHVIMGFNGVGKSTLGNVLAGREEYEVLGGRSTLSGRRICGLVAESRGRAALILVFECSVDIPGVSNLEFLTASVGAVRAHGGTPELTA